MASEPVRTQQTIAFGEDFELDLGAYELRRAHRVLRLERIPMEILLLLIEQRGNLVTREQIVERIWGKGVFLDTDNSINGAIRKIRQALKDEPEQPRFVQTVTGKGYRFIAQVVGDKREGEHDGIQRAEHVLGTFPANGGLAPAPHLPGKLTNKAPVSSRAETWVTAAFLTVVGIGLALWLAPMLSHRANAALPLHTIAVLPLDNLSGDPSQDYFADAMTDELITNLAKIGSLRVTSRTTITLYKHTSKKLPEIARELNVDGIVEGSVTRSGQHVRVTAQLIRAAADQHLWAESYEGDLGDALRLQSDVAAAIAQQVRAQLTPELKAQFTTAQAVNPEAYESYLRGRYHIYNESFTDPDALKEARASFEDAVRRDPRFSPAYSGLAETYVWMTLLGQGEMPAAEAFRLAREAIRKAIELDPNNGEAYDALGTLNWHADFDWKAADQAFSKAVALSPSYSCAHEDRAMFLAMMARRAESLAELETSKQIDPGPASAGVESAVYFQLREWDRLLESSRRQLASNANDWTVHASLGMVYESMRRFPEAIAEYQKAVELSNGDDLNTVASLGNAYAVAGRRDNAEKILRDVEQKSRDGKASPYLAAVIYAGLGETDKALALIEKAYQEKSLDISWSLKSDLRVDNLRSDPRFQTLLRRIGLT